MILLVEDHASIREALVSTFEREGFEVVGQAGSMAETRRMQEESQQAIDVAVIDLGLPDGYGGDLINTLRDAHPQALTKLGVHSQLQALVFAVKYGVVKIP